ncbi:MAG: hypothetical protein Kow0090_19850 [Myxococcota bacterium]
MKRIVSLITALILIASVLFASNCGSDVIDAISKIKISGKVKDKDGKALEGATVRLFKMTNFLKDPKKMKEITVPVGRKDPKLVIDIDKLLASGGATETKSKGDGSYEFTEQPPDFYIIVGEKEGYAYDILGIDFDTGEITEEAAIKPPDLTNPTNISGQDLMLMGGPMKDPAPITPDPPPEPPKPECENDSDCSDGKICVGGSCKFECESASECPAPLLCLANKCAPCSDNAECGEGEFCSSGACIDAECQADGDCTDAGKSKCENYICVPECATDDDCTEEGLAKCSGGACVPECDVTAAGECVEPNICKPFGKGAACKPECVDASECVNDFLCEENRCVPPPPPDPNLIHDPADSDGWKSFKLTSPEGEVLADASSGPATLDLSSLGKGRVVRVEGERKESDIEKALLRIQVGAYECGDVFPPMVGYIPLLIDAGKVVSELGDFQTIAVYPDLPQGFQLDEDEEPLTGNESYSIRNGKTDCNPPKNPFQAILTWNDDGADVDLHVWWVTEKEEKHIFYGKNARAAEGIGFLDVDDRNGYGPEVFTGDEGVSGGKFRVRVNFFSGTKTSTKGSVRVIIFSGGELKDETFSFNIEKRNWVDIGEFDL